MIRNFRDRARDKRIMQLYEQGHTYIQIGEKLNISRGRVGQLRRRIMKEKDNLNGKRVA